MSHNFCACLQSMYEWRTVSCAQSMYICAVTPAQTIVMQYENDHDNQLLLLFATAHALRMQQHLLQALQTDSLLICVQLTRQLVRLTHLPHQVSKFILALKIMPDTLSRCFGLYCSCIDSMKGPLHAGQLFIEATSLHACDGMLRIIACRLL